MREYDYQYDLYHQPFRSLPLDEDDEVCLRIQGCRDVFALEVKLMRCGMPGPLEYTLEAGGTRVQGRIQPEEVFPIFERYVRIPTGEMHCRGEELRLTLHVDSGKLPLNGYRAFGPAQGGDGFDDGEKPPYWWFDTDMATPKYYAPACYGPCAYAESIASGGQSSPAISFRVCESESDLREQSGEPFHFLEKYFAPKYSEWVSLPHTPVRPGEVLINADWSIASQLPDTLFAKNLLEEVKAFFSGCFGIAFTGTGNASILLRLAESGATGRDGHSINVSRDQVVISARELGGIRAALSYIEDVMLSKSRPALDPGVTIRNGRYDQRICSGVVPAPYNYQVLQSGMLFSQAYLWRFSRAGFNGLWLMVNMEELANLSPEFPQMHCPESAQAIERLERFTALAAGYGIDVYIQLATGYFKPFPEEAFQSDPGLRSYPKWGNYPCTGHPKFQAFMKDTIRGIFQRAKALKGVIVIYDTEGFYNCFANNKQSACPNCRDRTADELAKGFFNQLLEDVRSIRPDGEVVAWSYYCDDEWNYRLIKALNPKIKVMSCFSQFVHFSRRGVDARTDDYSVSVTGPGKYFQEIYAIASQSGKSVMAKTEVSSGQEFVSVPYLPVLQQHQRRWDALSRYTLSGFMGDYIHTHFRDSVCTDLMRLNCFDTFIDGAAHNSAQEKLAFAAALRYGKHADAALSAMELFSSALSEDFPYSAGVCRYPGPLQAGATQPFYLDPFKPVARKSARCNCGDLSWTRLYFPKEMTVGDAVENEWDDRLIKECFIAFNQKFDQGISALRGIQHPQVLALSRLARCMTTMVSSMLHFIDFVHLRDDSPREDGWQDEMKELLQRELKNTRDAIDLCRQDSELGFSGEGQGTVRGGLFNITTLEDKERQLKETMAELGSAIEQRGETIS